MTHDERAELCLKELTGNSACHVPLIIACHIYEAVREERLAIDKFCSDIQDREYQRVGTVIPTDVMVALGEVRRYIKQRDQEDNTE